MATTSKRALWKGAISFGLVHIPVALHSATVNQSLDFDWLDKRTMDRVGYKRVNKTTGKEVTSSNIVKGIEYEDGQYVVLSQDEIKTAYPKTTQTVEIEAFVSLDDIPFVYLDRPYYMSPIGRGAKVYALLREVLKKTHKVAVAKVVIQTKQHLAIVMACGPALVLNLLRWGDEVRPWDELELPPEGVKSTGLTAKELNMGEQLVEDMSASWEPEQFTDSFKEQIMALVREKAEAGDITAVQEAQAEDEAPAGATIHDLTEILQRSLKAGTRTPAKTADAPKGAKKAVKKTESKKARSSSKESKASAKDDDPSVAESSKAASKPASKKAAKSTAKKTAAKKSAKKSPAKKATAAQKTPARSAARKRA